MVRAIITVVLEDDTKETEFSGRLAYERVVVSGPNLTEKSAAAVWSAIEELADAYNIELVEDEEEVLPF